jgi:hypothetical protein
MKRYADNICYLGNLIILKDARSYLDNLAVRMSDELESIRRAKKDNPEQPILAQETPVQNSKQSPIPSQAQTGESKGTQF